MREQSGRSLIEIIGVLAISGIMVAGVFSMYQSISNRQKRMIASENLKEIATKTKTLLEYSGYQPVSVDFLVESGALKNTKQPIGTPDWSVTASIDGSEFSINVNGLTFDDCAYFTTKKFDWVDHISVNGYGNDASSFCLKTGENKISFFVK
jgi:type II secretory pathway pseudopilin PulG